MASGHVNRIKRPDTWLHRPMLQNVKKVLANPEPSTHVIRYAKIHGTKHRPWLTALLARRPTKVAVIALANKIARMVRAMMARGERHKEPVALAR